MPLGYHTLSELGVHAAIVVAELARQLKIQCEDLKAETGHELSRLRAAPEAEVSAVPLSWKAWVARKLQVLRQREESRSSLAKLAAYLALWEHPSPQVRAFVLRPFTNVQLSIL